MRYTVKRDGRLCDVITVHGSAPIVAERKKEMEEKSCPLCSEELILEWTIVDRDVYFCSRCESVYSEETFDKLEELVADGVKWRSSIPTGGITEEGSEKQLILFSDGDLEV